MSATLAQSVGAVKTIQLDDETFARVEPGYDLVTLCRGRCAGDDKDWGGFPIASLPITFLVVIAAAVQSDAAAQVAA